MLALLTDRVTGRIIRMCGTIKAVAATPMEVLHCDQCDGMWRSLAAHLVRDQGVMSSNLIIPTFGGP